MTGSGLLAKRPRLREDLIFSRPLQRGPDTVYLIKDRRSGRAFEIAPKEQFLLRRLDGARSLAEVGAEYAAEYGRRLGDEHWTRLLWLLHERDLLSAHPADQAAAPADPAATPGGDGERAAGGPVRRGALGWWARRLRWLLRPAVFALLAVLVAALLAVVGLRLGPLWHAARPAFTEPVSLVALALLAWFGAALHEFAHALVAVHFGATVNRINLITLTCKIEDYLYLPRRSQQVMIAAAGAVANGLVLLLVGAALTALPGAFADRLFSAYVLVAAAQTLVNVIPLPPLDGYKIVSHLLGQLNLAPESRRYLTTVLRRLLRRPGPRYPWRTAVHLGLFAAWWLLAVAAVAAVVISVGGALLRPAIGALSYVPPAAIVGLTIAGWLARPRRDRPADRTPPQPLNQDNQ
ncbi:M50 family metallopeptidase [Micromonospora sp. WMMD812]|uniref:M50 family metallopeptidase n=1 Tax=Micromonospora sp. WMMD812 TaxID=3015152 RepID=UPI00248D3468|nr:M50 family metallopeptidase [Micromonospora sp. WMMD812]WBB69632.1 M50 family metallopeptidase [Micromonospora sp. WMMD812]